MNEIMMKGMNRIMLDCDQATMLLSQSGFESIGCLRNFQLKLHLMGCKFCREFAKQSRMINTVLENLRESPEELHVHLNEQQKQRLALVIEQNR